MKTFNELYSFLLENKDENILDWLEKCGDKWEGKDKQESLLRLFGGLDLIQKLELYCACNGNFNCKTIRKNNSFYDVFYDHQNHKRLLKDKGDSSDLSCVLKSNTNHLLLTTSKNYSKITIGKLDISQIVVNFKQYERDKYTMSLCVCVPKIQDYNTMMKGVEESSQEIKNILNKKDTIIIDWGDLNQAYHLFKKKFNVGLNDIFTTNKNDILKLKLHQQYSVERIIKAKKKNETKYLCGHGARSGKSYIIAGCIYEDSNTKIECNYLVITTATSTLQQLDKNFKCFEFRDFEITVLSHDTLDPLSKKNVIICSKQFLQNGKGEELKVKWMKNIIFDMCFFDEPHYGGSTPLAQKIWNDYKGNSFQVFLTATYFKPINEYKIPSENQIFWDLDDIKMCKELNNIDTKTNTTNKERLIQKHGNEMKIVMDNFTDENIQKEYSKFPELQVLTDKLGDEITQNIISKTKNNDYGWSIETCFLLNQRVENGKIIYDSSFQKPNEVLKVWYRIFGKFDELGIPDKEYPEEKVFIKRIEKICKNTNSRYIGDAKTNEEPMVIMSFLPPNNINEISTATKELIKDEKMMEDYYVTKINSKITSNPKDKIERAKRKAKNSGKKGVLVLAGRQCGLGVTIKNCDVVLLLNNSMSFDNVYQMMFRSMTEEQNKKCGFVVDLDIQRTIETILIPFARRIRPKESLKDSMKYIIEQRLITLNADHWEESFGNCVSDELKKMSDNLYKIASSSVEKTLNRLIKQCRESLNIDLNLTDEEQKICNMFSINKSSFKLKSKSIKKGIRIIPIKKDEKDQDVEQKEDEIQEQKSFQDILIDIIPIICVLTIQNNSLDFMEMFKEILNSDILYEIFLEHLMFCFTTNINKNIEKFYNICNKYMDKINKTEFSEYIKTIKELFITSRGDIKRLSKLIDERLVPQEQEKKRNAEINTPYELRKEMLNKIPSDFWKTPHKIFEPCCGKGGFLIDIIDKFMDGLKNKIPNKNKRYKTILQECLYFSEKNPLNIFICKLLIDPEGKYEDILHYNQGDTLQLKIKKWDVDGFDAVICNPPYQDISSSGISKGGGNNLYTKFIYYADKCLNEDGYLLFINPPTYFGPGRSCNRNNKSLRKDVLEHYYYHHINLQECSKYFKEGSKFVYYLFQKRNELNDEVEVVCEYNGEVYTELINQKLMMIDYIPYLLTNDCLSILNKVKNRENNKLNIFNSPDNRGDKKHVIKRNKNESDKMFKSRAKENGFIYPIQATGTQLVYSLKKCKNQKDKKVLMSRSGYLRPFYDNGNIGVGGDCFACLVKNKTEGENIIKMLNSKLYQFYIQVNKWSGFHNKKVLQDLPNIINKIKVINDKNIYSYFGLTKDEIQLVEKNNCF